MAEIRGAGEEGIDAYRPATGILPALWEFNNLILCIHAYTVLHWGCGHCASIPSSCVDTVIYSLID
jgi:hypothetical protein